MSTINARRVSIVQFASGIEISKNDLDRAIAGGMKRVGLSCAPQDQRDDIVSTVYLMLVKFFANGDAPTGSVGSLAYKIAYRVAIDTFRRPNAYEKRRSYGIDVADARPAAGVLAEAPTAEAMLISRADYLHRRSKLAAALKTLSETDRSALIDALDRKVALSRKTSEETKFANLISQREKRAKDRLVEAYHAQAHER